MNTFQAVAVTRLYRMIADQIAGRIRAGDFPRGGRLPSERELAEQLQVSRASIREALIALEIEGYVEARQGSGVFVTAHGGQRALRIDAAELSSLDAVLHIVDLRRALETEIAAQAAARRSKRDMAAIDDALAAIATAVERGGDGVKEDVAFHRCIAQATGNPYFLATLAFVSQYLEAATRVTRGNEARHADLMRAVLQEHGAIADAIRRQDVEAAREAARIHMVNAAARLRQAHR
ncbi:GntR family transcriptional regulator [Achromobacter xylosoxidans]|nr:GntR family transcriptional regulator [Achromobacter xylosoxidans]